MPRLAKSREDILKGKQEREARYRLNDEAKAKKRERDRVHWERRKEQVRLRCHNDPLARLADVATQREYLEEENEVMVEEAGEIDESIDVGGVVEEDGEVLENLPAGAWEEGFHDDWEGGFDENFGEDTHENGMEGREITNCRGEYE
jgi:hypothetical protein